ncbi:LLM class F420-dependent oxidoreductase [Dactylosporangium sp. AC04546]|uniref:LLM class F420-dependent oxidoreductase n=1 Tax=Dactylosporangium sp. AC04546 TaxID=2862460 RepID=UPI001EE0527B|nr:LLM class F420-dependent oxidoreductase [Dactylosporangium sp. AC04546]WVK88267.1 LLM class F420-dependent oxidoreductase [Dactylosporangium sp. AC04546]
MKFAVAPPYDRGAPADPRFMTELAETADRLGFESLYLSEHIVVVSDYERLHHYTPDGDIGLPDDTPFPDPLAVLGHVAARTERLRLATSVLILPEHHPVQLAKRLATMDVLSGGRLRIGVGVGWMREEMAALGVDYSSRGRRTDEAIRVLRTLWGTDPSDFAGEFFAFRGARCFPKPVQPGGVPIHVGGHSEAAARRAGRLGDGFHPLGVDLSVLPELTGVVRRHATLAGRDPDAIEVTLTVSLTATDPAFVRRATAAGVDRLVLSCRSLGLPEIRAEMERIAIEHGL